MKQHNYFVYITSNPTKTVFYVGMTNDLYRRLFEHRENRGKPETFAGRYYCYKLLYYEQFTYVQHAIDRETELKLMGHEEKVALIKTINPKLLFLKIAD
ncbi:MAG: GIY-YIG nuclease family protein [Rufibacter sp.]